MSKCANGNSSSPRKVIRPSGGKERSSQTKRWNSVRQIHNQWSYFEAMHQDNVKLRNELLHHASIHNCKSSSFQGWPCSIAWSSFIDSPEVSSGIWTVEEYSWTNSQLSFRHSSLFCATTHHFLSFSLKKLKIIFPLQMRSTVHSSDFPSIFWLGNRKLNPKKNRISNTSSICALTCPQS